MCVSFLLYANACWHNYAPALGDVNSCWPTLVGMRRSSEQTKAVILAAARERFAESGFERATIRAIAADANIDPSMVMRYFGNKDQLFAAAADFDLQIPDLSDVDADQLGARLVAHFMDRWERDEALDRAVAVEHHECRSGATHAGDLRGSAAAGDRRGSIPSSRNAEPGLIATQVLGLALCRYVLRLPPVVGDVARRDRGLAGADGSALSGGTAIIGGDA